MKKLVSIVLLLASLFNFVLVMADSNIINKITVVLNDQKIDFDEPPFLDNTSNRVLVPMRRTFESLGAKVNWDEPTKTITATLEPTTVIITIDSRTAIINGRIVELDCPAVINSGRTFVPLRFIAQSLDKRVEWKAETLTVLISDIYEYPTPTTAVSTPAPTAIFETPMATITPMQTIDVITQPIEPPKLQIVRRIFAYLGSNEYIVKEDGTLWRYYNERKISQVEGWNNVASVVSYYGRSGEETGNYYIINNSGEVWAWGQGNVGQLGNGIRKKSETPVKVLDLDNVVDIACGDMFAIALKSDGTVWAWGGNAKYQLGNGTKFNSDTPKQIDKLSNIIAISAGDEFGIALKNDGTVWWWGICPGMTGEGKVPAKIDKLPNIVSIAASVKESCALTSDGKVYIWGEKKVEGTIESSGTNFFRLPTRKFAVQPVEIDGLSDVVQITSEALIGITVVDKDGGICSANFNIPASVRKLYESYAPKMFHFDSLDNITAVSCGFFAKKDNTLWIWDYRARGENYFKKIDKFSLAAQE